eukprot:12116327-Prorocentrum_lima.AAC.1
MEATNPGTLMKMNSEDREQWADAIRAELSSFADLDVFDQVMPEDITAMSKSGIHPKRLRALLILVKRPDPRGRHGWKPKARV